MQHRPGRRLQSAETVVADRDPLLADVAHGDHAAAPSASIVQKLVDFIAGFNASHTRHALWIVARPFNKQWLAAQPAVANVLRTARFLTVDLDSFAYDRRWRSSRVAIGHGGAGFMLQCLTASIQRCICVDPHVMASNDRFTMPDLDRERLQTRRCLG